MRLLDVDPFTGAREYFDYDEATDSITIHKVADVEGVLERNKRLQADTGDLWKHHDKQDLDMRLAASIPTIIIEKWKRELGVDVFDAGHWPAVRRLLNDPDWRWLKAADVKI